MVELIRRRHGLDWVAPNAIFVGGSFSDGSPRIDTLEQYDNLEAARNLFRDESELHFSLPDDEAIIKRIKIPANQTLDRKKLALFELTCTLPDDGDNYYLETIPRDGQPDVLGIACRRKTVDEKIAILTERLAKPSGFKTRSLALCSGYLNYCRLNGGELMILIDIGDGFVSYAFLHAHRPVMLGGLKLSKEGESETGREERLVDLVTVIQYQKLQLFNSGFSAPLSLIILSGSAADNEAAERIGEKLRVRTELPLFRPELFLDDLHLRAVPYLVGLGLTVEP